MRENADIKLGAEIDYYGQNAYLVASVTRDHLGGNRAPYFAVTGDLYSSRQAFDLGSTEAIIAGGVMHDEIGAAFPELVPIIDMHMAWTDNGMPMHGAANGWYYLSGKAAKAERDAREQGRKCDYRAPDPDDPGARAYYLSAACRALRCTTADLADVRVLDALCETDPKEARARFETWVDDVLRPRWQAEADAANAWIDANLGGIDVPAEVDNESEYEIELEGGLRLTAKLNDDEGYRPGVGPFYEYAVTVSDGEYIYEATYGGSTGDYYLERINAREAAFGVLRELCEFNQHDSPRDFAQEIGMEDDYYENTETRMAFNRCHAAAVVFSDHLERHSELVGR